MTARAPGEPRDYRRLIDLVGGIALSVVALVVGGVALLVVVLSHHVLADACDRATGPVTCNGPLLSGAYLFSVVGILAAVGALVSLQLRAYRRDSGLLVVPVVVMGAAVAVLLIGILLMRTAHPAAVGALAAGTVRP